MNGTELRSFSHFQILRNITYPDLSRNLESWEILMFVKTWLSWLTFTDFQWMKIHWKSVKVSQDNQVRMQTCFTSLFLMNGRDIRSFSHFQILTWIVYSDLSRNFGDWLILKFVFIHCKTVKVSQDDQIRM